MKKLIKAKNTQTLLNHPEHAQPRDFNPALINPIYQTAKFVMDPTESFGDQYIYTRLSNPSLTSLERSISKIQRQEETIVFSSGIAAITTLLLGLLKKGDHVISFYELYKPGRMFIRDELPKFGIDSTLLNLNDFSALEAAIIPGKTKLIHFESPTNPNLKIADIKKIVSIAHAHGVKVSMDSTFAGLHQNHEFKLDFIVQSLTKYANGHGDLLAGSLSGKKADLENLRAFSVFVGATLDPHAAFLIERGLRTYGLRYSKHSENALKVAEFLENHPAVEKVYYPGLKSHDDHDLALAQMKEMGGVVSFILKEMKTTMFIKKLEMIKMSVSLGSTESIIAPTELFFGSDLSQAKRDELGMNERSLRLSVGIEELEDILNDLKQALS